MQGKGAPLPLQPIPKTNNNTKNKTKTKNNTKTKTKTKTNYKIKVVYTEDLTHPQRGRDYSQSTARIYLHVISDFARYFRRSPDLLGPEQIRQYQVHLFHRKLSPYT